MLKSGFLIITLIILTGCEIVAKKQKKEEIKNMTEKNYTKVTGIGGIFFKCKNPEETKKWYNQNLGLITNEYGSLFEFRILEEKDKVGYLQWSPFSESTSYFEPSESSFMVNYRVDNLSKLADELKLNGVTILDTIESYEYGSFLHILDPENNKIELWEPIDSVFTSPESGKTSVETGIGGFMFKSENPAKLNTWYQENLGFKLDDYGSLFSFRNALNPDDLDYLRWSPMPENTDYLGSASQEYMINYRVQNIEELVKQLKDNNVTVLDTVENTDIGKFVHVLDNSGNKIELWEPDFK